MRITLPDVRREISVDNSDDMFMPEIQRLALLDLPVVPLMYASNARA